MPHRILAIALAGVLAATSTVMTATPALAASSCTVGAGLPKEVAIKSMKTKVSITLGDPGGCNGSSTFQVLGTSKRVTATVTFAGGSTSDTFTLTKADGAGTYIASGVSGVDNAGAAESTLASYTMTAKYDSRFTLHGHRKGSAITFTLRTTRFSYAAKGFTSWSGAHVRLQKKTGSKWHDVRSAATNGHGDVRFTVTGAAAQWRAVVKDSRTVWGGRTYSFKL